MAIVEYNGVKYNTSNKNQVKALQGVLGFQQTGSWGPMQQRILEEKKKENYNQQNKANSSLSYNKNYYINSRNKYLLNLAKSSYDPKAKQEALRYKKELTTQKPAPYIDNSKYDDFIKNKRVVLGKTYDITDPNQVGELQSAINKYLGVEHLTVDKIRGQRTELAINSLDQLKKYYDNKRKRLKKGEQLSVNKNAFLINKNGKIYGTTPFSNGMYQEFDKTTGRYKDITDSERGATLVDGKLYDADTEASKLQELTGQKVTGKWTNENQTYMSNMFNNAFQNLQNSYDSDWKVNGKKFRDIISKYDKNAKDQRVNNAIEASRFIPYSGNGIDPGAFIQARELSKDIDYDALGKQLTEQLEKDFKVNLSNTSSSSGNISYYSKAQLQKVLEAPENKNYAKALNYLKNSQKYLASLQHNDSYAEKMIKSIVDNLLLGAIHNLNKSHTNKNINKSEFAQGFKAENQIREQKNLQKINWTESDENIASVIGTTIDAIPDIILGISTGGTGTAVTTSLKQGAKQIAISSAREAFKNGATKAVAQKIAREAAVKYIKQNLGNTAKIAAKQAAKQGVIQGMYWTPQGTVVSAGKQANNGKIDWVEAGKDGLQKGTTAAVIGGALGASGTTASALRSFGENISNPILRYSYNVATNPMQSAITYTMGRSTVEDAKDAYQNFKEGNFWKGFGNTGLSALNALGTYYGARGLSPTVMSEGVYLPVTQGNNIIQRWYNTRIKNPLINAKSSLVDSKAHFQNLFKNKQRPTGPVEKTTWNTKVNEKIGSATAGMGSLVSGLGHLSHPVFAIPGLAFEGNYLYNQSIDRNTGESNPLNIVTNTASDLFSSDKDKFNNARMGLNIMQGFRSLGNSPQFTNYFNNKANIIQGFTFTPQFVPEAYNNFTKTISDSDSSLWDKTKSAGELYMSTLPFMNSTGKYLKDVGNRQIKWSQGSQTFDQAIGRGNSALEISKYKQYLNNIKNSGEQISDNEARNRYYYLIGLDPQQRFLEYAANDKKYQKLTARLEDAQQKAERTKIKSKEKKLVKSLTYARNQQAKKIREKIKQDIFKYSLQLPINDPKNPYSKVGSNPGIIRGFKKTAQLASTILTGNPNPIKGLLGEQLNPEVYYAFTQPLATSINDTASSPKQQNLSNTQTRSARYSKSDPDILARLSEVEDGKILFPEFPESTFKKVESGFVGQSLKTNLGKFAEKLFGKQLLKRTLAGNELYVVSNNNVDTKLFNQDGTFKEGLKVWDNSAHSFVDINKLNQKNCAFASHRDMVSGGVSLNTGGNNAYIIRDASGKKYVLSADIFGSGSSITLDEGGLTNAVKNLANEFALKRATKGILSFDIVPLENYRFMDQASNADKYKSSLIPFYNAIKEIDPKIADRIFSPKALTKGIQIIDDPRYEGKQYIQGPKNGRNYYVSAQLQRLQERRNLELNIQNTESALKSIEEELKNSNLDKKDLQKLNKKHSKLLEIQKQLKKDLIKSNLKAAFTLNFDLFNSEKTLQRHLDNKDIVQLKSDKKGQLQYANQYTDDSGNLYTLREINRNDFNDTVKDFFQLDGTRFKDPNVFIKYAVLSEVKKYIHDNIDKNPIHFGEKRANEIKTIFDKIKSGNSDNQDYYKLFNFLPKKVKVELTKLGEQRLKEYVDANMDGYLGNVLKRIATVQQFKPGNSDKDLYYRIISGKATPKDYRRALLYVDYYKQGGTIKKPNKINYFT